MPWYLLPTSCQNQISAAIHRLQNGATLTIGPLDEIDYETASDVSFLIFT